MYLLLRAPDFMRDSEEIPKTERIHEALYLFRRTRRLPAGDLVIKKDGCYSPSLALALEEAVESGEVAREAAGGVERYSLTDRGIAASKGAWDAAGDMGRLDAIVIKYKMTGIDRKELVSFLYGEFPETWTDPAMREKAKEWGFKAACSMYDRAKVSIGGGARMAGMDYEGFMRAYAAAGYVVCKSTAEDLDRFLDELDNAN
ncbi:MAG: hypothetical protein MPJ02_04110 [Nitrosopumilus sp.]|nr:hypothetical protein [Nitrosopumilus sp.]